MTGKTWGFNRAQTAAWICSGLLAGAAVSAPAQVLFEDNFDAVTDGERPSRDSWAIGGAIDEDYWFGDSGSLATGNLDNTPSQLNLAFVNKAEAKQWGDVSLKASFQMTQADGTLLLAVRQQDFANYYLAKLTSIPDSNGNTQRIADIVLVQRNVVTVLASKGQGGPALNLPAYEQSGTSHEVEFRAIGNRLVLLLDGAEVLSTTDPQNVFPKGSVGLGGASTALLFDRVTVASAAEGGGAAPAGVTGAGNWRLMAASGLSKDEAEKLKAEMIDSSQAELKETPNGWSILVGRYPSKEAADADKTKVIEREGFFSVEVVEDAPAASQAGSVFVVEAGVFNSAGEAEAVRTQLEETQGIFMFETLQEDGKFRLRVGMPFEERPEAEKFAEQIRAQAPNASVVTQAGEARTTIELDSGAMSTLSDRDRQTAQQIIDTLNSGAATADQQREIDRQFKEANSAVQEAVRAQQELARKQAESERTAAERNQLATEVSRLMEEKRWNEAQNRLIRLKEIDGGNPFWDKLLGDVQRGLAEDRNKPRNPEPTPLSPEDRLAALIDSAKEAETRANSLPEERKGPALDQARRLWQDVQRTATDKVNRDLAMEAIQRINSQVSESSSPQESGGSGSLMYIIGGVLALIIGGIVAFLMLGKKKAPAPAPAASRPATSPPTPLPVSNPTPVPSAPAVPATPAPVGQRTPLPVAQPTPLPKGNVPQPIPQTPSPTSQPQPGGTNVRIAPGVFLPAADAQPSGVLPPVASSPSGIPGVAAQPPAAQVTPVPMSPAELPTNSSGEVVLPDTNQPLHQTPASGVVQVAGTGDDYLVQSFDDEAVGATPKNWRGSYDYATLAVVERPEGGHCMKFEKKTGTGSAYFACRFPDAGGKVLVEFDLKCEDKNKYLLGFYIEKDEDFRHSIHTVVHKDAGKGDKVTLRLQNESAPYNLGEWVKVRFHIDLTRHLVDGYVNDKPVAIGVRLVSRPKVVNTLSIRDNLLTEGVLYIDNVRITRDR